MKTLYLSLLLLLALKSFSQNNGSLLLLKIDKIQSTKIDKYKTLYFAFELDNNYLPKDLSKPIFFDGFTDNQLLSCINKDSVRLKTYYKDDTWRHEQTEGMKNNKMVLESVKKMTALVKMNLKTSLYDQAIKISYILINCNYCTSDIADYDGNFIGYEGEIIIVINNLTFNSSFKLTKENKYEILKKINFNSFLF